MEEQQQGISPAAEEVLCSGEVDGERRGLQGAGGGRLGGGAPTWSW